MAKRPRTCVERDYTAYYARDVGGQAGNDHVVYKHPNGLCVVCLAPRHPLLALDEAALAAHTVDFDVGSASRLKAQVSGKKKTGAVLVQADTVLCHVQAADGMTFKLRACVRGKLLEVNDRLVGTPALFAQQPRTAGFVAILMPRDQDVKSMQESLQSAEAYESR